MNDQQDYTKLYPPPPAFPDAPDTEEAPRPLVIHSGDIGEETPPPPIPGAQEVHRLYYTPAPPREKKPFNPIPLLLVAGVAFLFLGGVIFLTGTWEMLPNGARAAALLSAGVVAFAANILAERKLKLPKTGLAFYILGCIFLPLALAGIGAFQLLGSWFSFDGDGRYILMTSISVCVAVIAAVGQKSYRSNILAGISLTGAVLTGAMLSAHAGLAVVGGMTGFAVMCALWVVCCAGAAVWTEWELRRRPEKDSPYAMAALPFLGISTTAFFIIMLFVQGIIAKADGLLRPVHITVTMTVVFLLMAVLFGNYRFISDKFHAGVLGSAAAVLTACYLFTELPVFREENAAVNVFFTMTAAALLLTAAGMLPRVREELTRSYGGAGMILSVPVLLYGGGAVVIDTDYPGALILLMLLLLVGLICYWTTKKNPLTKDTPLCVIMTAVISVTAVVNAEMDGSVLVPLLLILAALVTLAGFLMARRMWALVLGLSACAGMLLGYTGEVLYVLGAAMLIFFAGTVYAHLRERVLLEKVFAWGTMTLLLPLTLQLLSDTPKLEYGPAWTLLLVLLLLLTAVEGFWLRGHLRTVGTMRYLTIVTVPLSMIAVITALNFGEMPARWCLLLITVLLIFSGLLTQKLQGLLCVPELILVYCVFRRLMTYLDGSVWLQAMSCLLLLVIFAAMGHFLIPVRDGEEKRRIDYPLLAGVLPVIDAGTRIDWYPSIVVCLLLSVYALLFCPRVKNKRIPMILSALFFCTALEFHAVNDPFGILEKFRDLDMITPQVLMYLIPVHLFILLLRFILPEESRSQVDLVRFLVYCVTMLCLLTASLFFGNVADAIVLVVFSFLILVGSFAVKRLRWFILGFAVLVVMTVRLTWSFWTSLHWGIYLFLAGIMLIVMASLYEYRSRRVQEHPEEAEKKPRLFKDWVF